MKLLFFILLIAPVSALKSDLRGIETALLKAPTVQYTKLKSDLRGIETRQSYLLFQFRFLLKSDLRGIETCLRMSESKEQERLKSDLRGIETLKHADERIAEAQVKIRP